MRRARFREFATPFVHCVVQPAAEFRAEGRGAEPGDLMRKIVETFERLDSRLWANRANNVTAAPASRSF